MCTYELIDNRVKAYQWWMNGDHPDDQSEIIKDAKDMGPFLSEGKVVRRYRNLWRSGDKVCDVCGYKLHVHGWMDIPDTSFGMKVCPGSWIVESGPGSRLAISDKQLHEFYRKVEDPQSKIEVTASSTVDEKTQDIYLNLKSLYRVAGHTGLSNMIQALSMECTKEQMKEILEIVDQLMKEEKAV